MKRAIFLDRDGTIIEERGFICHLSESRIFPFTSPAIRLMNKHLFEVIVISNQSSVARGICTREQVETIHSEITKELKERGAIISKFYYSPYHKSGIIPEYSKNSENRKPAPGMIFQAAKDFSLNLSSSYMIGDSLIDIQTGANAGCQTILVQTGKGKMTLKSLKSNKIYPDFITENILTAIEEIISREGLGID